MTVPRLRESKEDFLGLVGATAEATRLPQAFVEKDYWVTELLRSIARPIDRPAIPIFKGGTSLSKIYRIVERFSEDVDILVQLTPPEGEKIGAARCDTILKTFRDRALADLGLGEAGRGESRSSKGEGRSQEYIYPVFRPSGVIKPGVTLEIGIRGEPFPRTRQVVRSYMTEHAVDRAGAAESDFEEFLPFEIQVLNPELTLIEKLAMLHDTAARYPELVRQLEQAARHLYDVARLLAKAEVQTALESTPGIVASLAERADSISEKFKWSFTPRPADGYGASPAFDPEHAIHPVLRPAYEHMLDVLVYGTRPEYDECLATVRRHARLL